MNPFAFSARGVVTAGFLFIACCSPAVAAGSSSLQIVQTSEARFPHQLINHAVTSGEAWVMISVSKDGELSDVLPTRYTHRAFADEAVRALRDWHYLPPEVDGTRVPVRTEVYFSFEATGTLFSLDFNGVVRSLASFADQPVYIQKLCTTKELDAPPSAVRTVSPPLPPANSPAVAQTTVIDFIIDETGRARMPVLVSSPWTPFAEHAANALGQWQFKPPTRRGQPVAVRVRQAFFVPPAS